MFISFFSQEDFFLVYYKKECDTLEKEKNSWEKTLEEHVSGVSFLVNTISKTLVLCLCSSALGINMTRRSQSVKYKCLEVYIHSQHPFLMDWVLMSGDSQ